MAVTLESLELTPEEREARRDIIRRMAYFNWLNAGCPQGDELTFWAKAEREWLEHSFVPHREWDGTPVVSRNGAH